MYKANPETVLLVTAVLSPSQQRISYDEDEVCQCVCISCKTTNDLSRQKAFIHAKSSAYMSVFSRKDKTKANSTDWIVNYVNVVVLFASTLIKKCISIFSS